MGFPAKFMLGLTCNANFCYTRRIYIFFFLNITVSHASSKSVYYSCILSRFFLVSIREETFSVTIRLNLNVKKNNSLIAVSLYRFNRGEKYSIDD